MPTRQSSDSISRSGGDSDSCVPVASTIAASRIRRGGAAPRNLAQLIIQAGLPEEEEEDGGDF